MSGHNARFRRARLAVPGQFLITAIMALGVTSTAAPALAASGATRVYTSTQSRYQLTIDERWGDGPGYRPLRCKLQTPNPPATDTPVTVHIRTNEGYYGMQQNVAVRKELTFPAGSTLETFTIPLPQTHLLESYFVELYINGRLVPRLNPTVAHVGSNPWDPNYGVMLEVNPKGWDPNLTALVSGQSAGTTRFQIAAAQLPESWIEYTSVDVVGFSIDDLRNWPTESKAKRQALTDWIRAGGQLIVFDLPKDFKDFAEIDSLLGLAGDDRSGKEPSNWTPKLATLGLHGSIGGMDVEEFVSEEPSVRNVSNRVAPMSGRSCGLGIVIAVEGTNNRRLSYTPLSQAVDALGTDRILWQQRHGMSMVENNPDFYNFMIPGVGLPPVRAFQILITLFVLAIGPVNYFLLKRKKLLQMMIFTAPIMAVGVTFFLIAWAAVSDGLSTRLRMRTMTVLDQQAGHAASWGRVSYYSGLAPSDGLQFYADTAVYPLQPFPFEEVNNRHTNWIEEAPQQRLSQGWLKSRTPMQLLAVRSHQSQRELKSLGITDGKARVENQLGVPIKFLLWADEDGQMYGGKSIGAGETVSLATGDVTNIRAGLVALLRQSSPSIPPEYVGVRTSPRRNYYYFMSTNSNLGFASSTSLLEEGIQEVLQNAATGSALPPRSYVAITTESVDLAPGVTGEFVEQTNVIRGNW